MRTTPATPRLLIVPGLHDSGPAHWQTWLQGQERGARRVVQSDWGDPVLERWAARIDATLAEQGPGDWIAVAHSFGSLALARHLGARKDTPIKAALFVAPADPDKFGVADLLPSRPLVVPAAVVSSDTDPWMSAAAAADWAQRWEAGCINLGDAGHINAEAGFGPLPLARRWVHTTRQRLQRPQRAGRAHVLEWRFAL
jgi:predicted alpha/beta hydrolase family esterase